MTGEGATRMTGEGSTGMTGEGATWMVSVQQSGLRNNR